MSVFQWLSLAALCLAGAASPGPSLAVVVSASLEGGRSTGFGAAWAHAIGVGLYAALTVFGLSALITGQPWLFVSLQVAGAAYLLWLAFGLWRHAGTSAAADANNQKSHRRAMLDGFAVAFLNPKLAVFMLALFSQFIRPGASLADNGLLIATALVVDGAWYTFVTLMVTHPGWVAALRRNARVIDRVFGVLLALLATTILVRLVI